MSVLGIDIYLSSIISGLITGTTYGLLAFGLVLIYRATRVINFAQGQLGALGAFVLAKLTLDYDIPFLVALPAVLAAGAAVGAVIEIGVVRRLSNSPRLMVLVATIGVSQLLLVAQLMLPRIQNSGDGYQVVIGKEIVIGQTTVTGASLLVIAVVPAVILTLTYFLTRTPYGLVIKASAENRDAARLAQIRVKWVSTGVWALAGGLAVLTSVLNLPLTNQNVNVISEGLGPALLLRALVAAMIGRFESLPLTFLGGLVVGVVEAVVLANFPGNPGAANAVLLVLVLVLLLVRKIKTDESDASDSAILRVRPLPALVAGIWWLRALPIFGYAGLLVLAVLAPLVVTGAGNRFTLTVLIVYPVICLSLTVLAGWAGQISLGQYAYVGIGAFAAGGLTLRGVEFPAAVVLSTLLTAAFAAVMALPVLRMRGLFVAISTLALAVAVHQWLFELAWVKGTFELPQLVRPTWLRSDLSYYYFALAFVVLAFVCVSVLQRSGSARLMQASRDNENAATAFGVDPRRVKIVAFAFAGALAGLGGSLLGGAYIRFGAEDFGPTASLTLISMLIVGGIGLVSGAVLGPLWIIGLPLLIGDSPTVALAMSGIGLLVFLLYVPQGLASFPLALRDALVRREVTRAAATESSPVPKPAGRTVAVEERPPAPAGGIPILAISHLRKDFGGLRVLTDVSIEVRRDEVVGLIGANGAGKSTLLNIVSGLLPATSGQIFVNGLDITREPAHRRAALGVGRTFQDARLFGSLTVQECLEVAAEQQARSEFIPDLFSLPPAVAASRARRAVADDLLALLGLGRFRHTYVRELSTGTRRIVELACQVALRPAVMLLDEPTAGVAQRETERFGPLIRAIKAELGASIVVVEHDMPLVTSMSDRMYCLGSGVVLAEGAPGEVVTNPAVVAAYLGTDERAITRSGPGSRSADADATALAAASVSSTSEVKL